MLDSTFVSSDCVLGGRILLWVLEFLRKTLTVRLDCIWLWVQRLINIKSQVEISLAGRVDVLGLRGRNRLLGRRGDWGLAHAGAHLDCILRLQRLQQDSLG